MATPHSPATRNAPTRRALARAAAARKEIGLYPAPGTPAPVKRGDGRLARAARAAARRLPPMAAGALTALALIAVGVSVFESPKARAQERPPQNKPGVVKTLDTQAGKVAVERMATGLEHPWGLAFLPNGDLLVTERAGRLRILKQDGTLSEPLEGVPEVWAQGQGGLLDVALHPDFRNNRMVYLSFAERAEDGASTALGRGRLEEGRIEGFQVIFRQLPKVGGPNHFGGRIAFTPDGNLFLTMGERFKFEPAQNTSDHLGTIVRLDPDGGVPKGNPFADEAEARPEIWSYGHRNVEAAAIHPDTGQLWIAEMGPRGGDELNRPEAGRNYGWPVVSWGRHYDGRDIPDPPTQPRFADAVIHWTPVISPSGMLFYTGEMFGKWRGSMFIGGLTAKGLVRVAVDGKDAREVERIALGARTRDVEQAPDGSIWVLTDQADGDVWRLRPAD